MYQEILESRIANFAAMAERMKPDVENKVHSQVNTNTIIAALKKLANDSFSETS